MNAISLALAATIVLAAGFICTGWWLVADTVHLRRRARTAADYAQRYQAELRPNKGLSHPAHLFCGQPGAVTVTELLDKAARQEGTRINWPEIDPDEAELIRPYAQDLFPTAVLPRVEG
jgi:hypothetical protein